MDLSDSSQKEAYRKWLEEVKAKVRQVRTKAALSANASLIHFYWELGEAIVYRQSQSQWGDKVLDRLSKDLGATFPDSKGFSVRNLKYVRRFYQFYGQDQIGQQPVAQLQKATLEKRQQLVAQIPWGHNIQIFTKAQSIDEGLFYAQETLINGWSRDTLAFQIKSGLHKRLGKAITNFDTTLDADQSELAKQTIKDPYVFDFMGMGDIRRERDIENQLIGHISKFLIELGKGFAFMGRQYHLMVADKDYYIDLLFYHVTLKCYVVIELKNTAFTPEYAGKLNFYLSAIDDTLKSDSDQPTIGILLCRDKNNLEVEFALRGMSQPMGVSEFQLSETLPDTLKNSLPTVEEIERELEK